MIRSNSVFFIIQSIFALLVCLSFSTSSLHAISYTFSDRIQSQKVGSGSVSITYDSSLETLDFSTDISTADDPDAKKTFTGNLANGFRLVLSEGPNPKRNTEEMAIFYFDLTDSNSPIMSSYVYDAKKKAKSWRSGQRIASYDSSSANLGFFGDANNINMNFSLDVSFINNFKSDPNWTGASFGDLVGVWFHPVYLTDTSYDTDGFLTSWEEGAKGFLDVANVPTEQTPTEVPEPGTILLLLSSIVFGKVFRLKKA